MNFLIVSRISIPAKDRTLPCWEYLRSLGHTVTVEHPGSPAITQKPDVIISMGVTIMSETFEALARFPGVPLYCYNWDVYEWVWTNPRPGEYDYKRYGELLKRATKIWVPSECTGRRTTQWYGLTNWEVILSACPFWDYPCKACDGGKWLACQWAKEECAKVDGYGKRLPAAHSNAGAMVYYTADHKEIPFKTIGGRCTACKGTGSGVRDDGYALCCLREIPDPWWGKFEQACEELGIPYKMTRHEVSYEEYQDAVAGCRFLCAPLYELSTGGLSLMEGYYLGKPVLISDSEWNGGRDYFKERASYFRHGDMADFKRALIRMHGMYASFSQDRDECREHIATNFSDRRMVDDMLRSIQE